MTPATDSAITPAARSVAALVGLLALFGLALDLAAGWAGTLIPQLWGMARYFTILTNGIAAATLLGAAAAGRPAPPGWLGGVTLWMAITALVFHLLLGGTYPLLTLDWGANLVLHTLAPAAVLAWWLAAAPTRGLGPRHAILWLGWPALYCGYALLRGAADGVYPYFFVDVARLGWAGFGRWFGILLVAFWVGGLLLAGLGRAIDRPGGRPLARG
ncbi:Pr6Pr family membrane protein [Wenxinia saemankumensis]|uniref:FAR-17a/AIG1-like protein n=1 Tax=Wenxinia saemankumensis TaxID=1447782 RepID=A0A1M6EHC6_9RHOB|nr:Pr6Pr family membrane protein [Wenxinia saemankumensis]SHI84907.1 hypothetical protein SAMN05444417_2001 [Wenxinia saemankumensis]